MDFKTLGEPRLKLVGLDVNLRGASEKNVVEILLYESSIIFAAKSSLLKRFLTCPEGPTQFSVNAGHVPCQDH
jgi:hypothetical protein